MSYDKEKRREYMRKYRQNPENRRKQHKLTAEWMKRKYKEDPEFKAKTIKKVMKWQSQNRDLVNSYERKHYHSMPEDKKKALLERQRENYRRKKDHG